MNEYSDKPISILRASTIANTLNIRANMITKHMSAIYKEQQFDKKLKSLLNGSAYERYILEIRLIVRSTCEKNQFYTALIDQFGYHLGLKIYRMLKSNYYVLKDTI